MDIRDAFFEELYQIALRDKNVIILTADMGFNEFQKFRELKGQFYNVGISEQNMIGMAAGLALQGKRVYVYTIAAFLQRAFEQIKIDICQMNLPVTIIGGCVGLSNSTDGYTHYCINDITCMRTLPNLTILNPSSAIMAKALAKISYESKSPIYIRMDKGELFEGYIENSWMCDFNQHGIGRYKLNQHSQGITKQEIDDYLIIATGNMVEKAMLVSCNVIDVFRLNPLDKEFLLELIERNDIKQIITLEEHLPCGLGSIISEFLTDNNLNIPLKRIGVTKTSPIGSREYMQKLNGLDVENLKKVINGHK